MLCLFLAVTLVVTVSADLRSPLIQEHPYLVSIHEQNVYLCSGAIISPHYVITTAQCVTKNSQNKKLTIRSGSSDVDEGGDTHEVTTVAHHDMFVSQPSRPPAHDIAVLQVDTPFKYNDKCKSVQLFEVDEKISEDTKCAVAGWINDNKEYFLSVTSAATVRRLACEIIISFAHAGYNLPEGQICALTAFVHKDSGALMIVDGRLAGLGSWGIDRPMPSMFTEIAAYREWIGKHSDVTINFMPKISASLLLIILVQMCIVVISF